VERGRRIKVGKEEKKLGISATAARTYLHRLRRTGDESIGNEGEGYKWRSRRWTAGGSALPRSHRHRARASKRAEFSRNAGVWPRYFAIQAIQFMLATCHGN